LVDINEGDKQCVVDNVNGLYWWQV
jgi:hypothetical protein